MTAATAPFLLVDAFAERPFTGNSAGVVLLDRELEPRAAQAIAREVNSAETAFVRVDGLAADPMRPIPLRWFTPSVEVDFCGHATIAAAAAIHAARVRDAEAITADAPLRFETRSGLLEVFAMIERDATAAHPLWRLRMPEPKFEKAPLNVLELARLLGAELDVVDPVLPLVRTRDQDVIVVVSTWQRLNELRPNRNALRDWCQKHRLRGVVATTTHTVTKAAHVSSRFFAPAAGVDEDPVTGSMHGPLVAFLAAHGRVPVEGGVAELNCLQGIPGDRGGLVRAFLDLRETPAKVEIGGRAYVSIQGRVVLPS
ncbi:MAG: PhzF family phenazine biosynthesis protein [Phycisphaerae bacterium]|nr:PhzF family phenazine biosynthesis protein [Phycisphaerae bacterium]